MLKINSFPLFTCVAIAFLSAHAFGQPSNEFRAGHGFCEDLQQGVVLMATSNAPAGASGRAWMVAINDNGTNTSVLFIKTTGLTNGDYFVSLGQLGNTNITSLGSLNVAGSPGCLSCGHEDEDGDEDSEDHGDGEHGDGEHGGGHHDRGHHGGGKHGAEKHRGGKHGDGEHDNGISSSFTNWLARCSKHDDAFRHFVGGNDATNQFRTNIYHWYTNCLTVGSGSFLLPSDLVQSNIAGIWISDSNGRVVLSGDFTGVTNSTSVYIETVSLEPGTATNLQGMATLKLTTRNGRTVGAFKLSASGLEPRQKLYLTANGTSICPVRTSSTGTLTIKRLPRANLATLQTLVATDTSSNIVFSASF